MQETMMSQDGSRENAKKGSEPKMTIEEIGENLIDGLEWGLLRRSGDGPLIWGLHCQVENGSVLWVGWNMRHGSWSL